MVTFDLLTVLKAIISALIFGAIFSFFSTLISIICNILPTVILRLSNAFAHCGNSSENTRNIPLSSKRNMWQTVLMFLSFGIGFTILSYVALDGNLRLYMLFFAVISYRLSYKYIFLRIKRKAFLFITKIANSFVLLTIKALEKAKKHKLYTKTTKN